MLQTEFEFTLPKGFIDRDGNLHRDGIMRLANASDEIAPLQDPRVQRNSAYLTIILLSRVVTRLGSLEEINPSVIERMFAADVSYLQELYERINGTGDASISIACPRCEERVQVDASQIYGEQRVGELRATP